MSSQLPPDKRLQNLFSEFVGILSSLIGWAEIFEKELYEQSIPSIKLLDFQQELKRIVQEFLNIRNSAFEEGTYFYGTEDDVQRWRKKLLIPANELMSLATKIETSISEMDAVLPNGAEIAETIIRIANRMRMSIDFHTNPDFQSPEEKTEDDRKV